MAGAVASSAVTSVALPSLTALIDASRIGLTAGVAVAVLHDLHVPHHLMHTTLK